MAPVKSAGFSRRRARRRGNVGSTARTVDGRDVMKSFQVADFKAAGVGHSALQIWEGGYDLGHGRKPLSLKDRGVSLPRTMGHETVGEVLAFGPDAKASAQGDLKGGDIALVYPWLGCGKCEVCLAGEENMCLKPYSLGVHCDGGYADHM